MLSAANCKTKFATVYCQYVHCACRERKSIDGLWFISCSINHPPHTHPCPSNDKVLCKLLRGQHHFLLENCEICQVQSGIISMSCLAASTELFVNFVEWIKVAAELTEPPLSYGIYKISIQWFLRNVKKWQSFQRNHETVLAPQTAPSVALLQVCQCQCWQHHQNNRKQVRKCWLFFIVAEIKLDCCLLIQLKTWKLIPIIANV